MVPSISCLAPLLYILVEAACFFNSRKFSFWSFLTLRVIFICHDFAFVIIDAMQPKWLNGQRDCAWIPVEGLEVCKARASTSLRTWVDLARHAQGSISPKLKAQTSIYRKFDKVFLFLDNRKEFQTFASRDFK